MTATASFCVVNVRGINDPGKLSVLHKYFPEVLADFTALCELKLASPAETTFSTPLEFQPRSGLDALKQFALHNRRLLAISELDDNRTGGCAALLPSSFSIRKTCSRRSALWVHGAWGERPLCFGVLYVHPTPAEFFADDLIAFCCENLAEASAYNEAVVLAGDFNLVLDPQDRLPPRADPLAPTEALRLITQAGPVPLRDAYTRAARTMGPKYTYPASQPAARLDRIYTSDLPVLELRTFALDFNFDHCAVCASIVFHRDVRPSPSKRLPRSLLEDLGSKLRMAAALRAAVRIATGLSHCAKVIRTAGLKEKRAAAKRRADAARREREEYRNTPVESREDVLAFMRKEKMAVLTLKYFVEGESGGKEFYARPEKRSGASFVGLRRGEVLVTNPSEALEIARAFYADLYAPPPTCLDEELAARLCADANLPRLAPGCGLSGNLSVDDLEEAIIELAGGKSPGPDGISGDFFKLAPKEVATFLHKHWLTAMQVGHLPSSVVSATVSLLPKPGKDPSRVENLRPISLLNSSYKIYAKALALRLGRLLRSWVHGFQTGFVPGRAMYCNVLEAQEIYEQACDSQSPLVMGALDFAKAFDTTRHDWIAHVLRSSGIDEGFGHAVSVLLANASAKLSIAGYLSESFRIGRGVRQGCPLSPLLFAVAVEPLVRLLNRKAAPPPCLLPPFADRQVSSSRHYADDTLLIAYSRTDLEDQVNIVDQFGQVSGLLLNKGKCAFIAVSEEAATWSSVMPSADWSHASLSYLGHQIGFQDGHHWNSIIERVIKRCRLWRHTRLSIAGRVTLWNAYVAPLILHAAAIYHVDPRTARLFRKLAYAFAFGSENAHKIRADRLSLPRDVGGLGMQLPKFIEMSVRVRQLQQMADAFAQGWIWPRIWADEMFNKMPRAPLLNRWKLAQCDESRALYACWSFSRARPLVDRQISPAFHVLRPRASLVGVPMNASKALRPACAVYPFSADGSRLVIEAAYRESAFPSRFFVLDAVSRSWTEWLALSRPKFRSGVFHSIAARPASDPNSVSTTLYRSAALSPWSESGPLELYPWVRNSLGMIRIGPSDHAGTAPTRIWKSRFRATENIKPLQPYHRLEISDDLFRSAVRLLFTRGKVSPAVASFGWLFLLGRLFLSERIARYADVSRPSDPLCKLCRTQEETLEHLFCTCPLTTPLFLRARALYVEGNLVLGPIPVDANWFGLAPALSTGTAKTFFCWWMTYMKVVWSARCTAINNSPVAFPSTSALSRLEAEWRTFLAARKPSPQLHPPLAPRRRSPATAPFSASSI